MPELHSVQIILDERHQVAGVTVVHHWMTPAEQVRPLGVGPFDTPEEALALALSWLPKQLVLWDDGT